MDLARRATAEAIGTALLLAAVVGSGIMGQRFSGGNVGLALLANSIATGGALVAIILAFGPISGAHLNPAVTIVDAWQHGLAWRDVPIHIGAQIAGAITGVAIANVMFGLPLFTASHHMRTGGAQWLGSRSKPAVTTYAVAAFIVGAYWFTSSTSFANPAVTIARSLSDTFAGSRPTDAPGFILAQMLGAVAATVLLNYLLPVSRTIAQAAIIPHQECLHAHSAVHSRIRP